MKIKAPSLVLTPTEIDRVIQMAWKDLTPFEAIALQFRLNESAVVALMRSQMNRSSFKMWCERMNGRTTKHAALRSERIKRFRCAQQRD